MDRHDFDHDVTADEVAAAHLKDLHVQDKYGVRYINYWLDYQKRTAFCLVDAPSRAAAEHVHHESHGLVANQIIEVDRDRFENFFGSIEEAEPGKPIANPAIRTILFTDIAGSVALTQRLGDEGAMQLLRLHDNIIQEALRQTGGRRVKHTGDGMMACFYSVARAAQCAITIQRALSEQANQFPIPFLIRIGLTAGEPVDENDDLFGAAVQIAARICAACTPGAIFASSVVRDLSVGKGLRWKAHGEQYLPGLEEPLQLFELVWEQENQPI
jgi:class 3 adenylate cyclase